MNKACWRNQPFSFFEQLTIVFGKYRASRKDAQSYIDITTEMDTQAQGYGPDDSAILTEGEEEMVASDIPCSEGTNIMFEATPASRRK